ncbi:MAG: SIS domain-containing protein [Clostridiales bacterium]|nr:SIS domain-containing protein [Clostridiales bacterium]
MSKASEYIESIKELIECVSMTQTEPLDRAAGILSETLKNDGWIYIFGTGHSHMLAEELFYRAGGLVRIKPILEPGLMLHGGAGKSTRLERLSGYAEIILDDYGITQNDCLILISNSGGNSVLTEAAQYARRHGIKTVALTSINHSTGVLANNPNRQMLFKLCNVVLDNCGCYGDACVSFGEKKAAPTSTVIGAMILNALVCLTVEKLEEQGIEAEIFKSSNTAGGNDYNKTLIGKYKNVIKEL